MTTATLSVAGSAQMMLEHVFSQHGLPESIVSDRGAKFVSQLWIYNTNKLKIKHNLSTACHPQTDGQTDRVNQNLEQYLRVFSTHNQDNWTVILSQASLAYNNTLHSGISFSPFYAISGNNPQWVEELEPSDKYNTPAGQQVVACLISLRWECIANLAEANRRAERYYNARQLPAPDYDVGNLVLLTAKNFQIQTTDEET